MESPTEMLNSILRDPADPRWSSFLIDSLFSKLHGTTKQKLDQLLLAIDDRLAVSKSPLTETQANFLREVTIRNFIEKDSTPFRPSELSWLVDRFSANPTPQRAVIIALLVLLDDLPPETSVSVKNSLLGTPGQRFIDLD